MDEHNVFWDKFIQNVRTFPNKKVIIEATGYSITYEMLNDMSDVVANYIVANKATFGNYIATSSRKNIESIIIMIAIMKTGRAYIPIDDNMPSERKKFILKKCNNSFIDFNSILNDRHLIISTDEFNLKNVRSSIQDSAYVIYTSGSTGEPKGVEISYQNMISTFIDINDKFGINQDDVILNLAPFDFDLSVYDIFNTIMIGATMVIIEDSRNIPAILECLDLYQITLWNSVPMVMEMLVNFINYKDNQKVFNSVEKILLSGDKTYIRLAQNIQTKFPNANIISLGGATECSIWSNYFEYKNLKTKEEIIPYGYALPKQQLLILDNNLNQCLVSKEGEIYIGGSGVAKGYFKNTEKTEQSFIMTKEFGRIYKTGDAGVLTKYGYINFLGRLDRQCKIRGYRIELDEIEKVITKHCNVLCAVGVSNESIVAKVSSDTKVNNHKMREIIGKYLPTYMIPTKIEYVDKIILTKNGKVDYKAMFKL